MFDSGEYYFDGSAKGLEVDHVDVGKSFDAVLKNATANNNAGQPKVLEP